MDLKSGDSELTALRYATNGGHEATVQLLLKHGSTLLLLFVVSVYPGAW